MINALFLILISIFAAFGQAPASDVTANSASTVVGEPMTKYCEDIGQVIPMLKGLEEPTTEELYQEYMRVFIYELNPGIVGVACEPCDLANLYEEAERLASGQPPGKATRYGRLQIRYNRDIAQLIKRYERELPQDKVETAREAYRLSRRIVRAERRDTIIARALVRVREQEVAFARAGVNYTPFDPNNPQLCPAE